MIGVNPKEELELTIVVCSTRPLFHTIMSRVPPFPSRRRAPSTTSKDDYSSQPTSAPGSSTRPLAIARSPSRPQTPSNSSYVSNSPQYAVPNTAPVGPLRPQRSELRARASEYSTSERGSVASNDPYYRESFDSGSRPDGRSYATSNAATPTPRSRTPRAANGGAYMPPDSGEPPTSLDSVLTAFRSAASRKNTVDEDEYWKERAQEIEAEKVRQQRIRERVPGVKPLRGNTRGGELDGKIFAPCGELRLTIS